MIINYLGLGILSFVVTLVTLVKLFPPEESDETWLESLFWEKKAPGTVPKPLKHDLHKVPDKKQLKQIAKAVKTLKKKGKKS